MRGTIIGFVVGALVVLGVLVALGMLEPPR